MTVAQYHAAAGSSHAPTPLNASPHYVALYIFFEVKENFTHRFEILTFLSHI